MLKFKKSELDFLSLFNLCKDSKKEYTDKVYIRKINNNIIFMMITDKNSIFKVIETDSNDSDFSIILPITEFYNMLSTCKEDNMVIFNEDSIKFGENSVYNFESYEHLDGIYDIDFVFEIIENSKKTKIHLNDIEKLKEISFCFGVDDFDIFSYQDNHWVLNNGNFMTAVNKIDLNIEKETFKDMLFPSVLFYILKFMKKKEFDIIVDTENQRYIYEDNNVYFVLPFVDPVIFNIFEEDKKVFYEHNNEIKFHKKDVLTALKRINNITNSLYNNKIEISFEKDNMIIRNTFGIQGNENIKIDYPKVCENQKLFINSPSLIKSLESLNDNIIIKLPDNFEDASVIKVEDDKKNKFFILNLLEE